MQSLYRHGENGASCVGLLNLACVYSQLSFGDRKSFCNHEGMEQQLVCVCVCVCMRVFDRHGDK